MIDIGYTVAGALTGVVVGLTGVGGGALMTPILLLVFGVAPVTAIATDLWFAAITKVFGALIHNKGGHVDWIVVRRLWMGSLPVALLTVFGVSAGQYMGQDQWLTHAVGVVIVITALGMVFAPFLLAQARQTRLSRPQVFKAMQPGLTVLAGAVQGLLVALTSVGAGALGSVMMLFLYPLRLTPHRLVATDLVHAIPLAVVAGTGYLLLGLVKWSLLASLLAGSIPGVVVGSVLAARLSGRIVQIAIATVLLMVGAKLTV